LNILRFFRWKIDAKEKEREKHLQTILKQQYNDLNSLSWQEIIIIFLFIILITLWIIRDFSDDYLLIIFKKESV
jgi:di/tricarboxylate transporter